MLISQTIDVKVVNAENKLAAQEATFMELVEHWWNFLFPK
jgi:hypothetical protein